MFAANAVARASHIIHPATRPRGSPKASRAYRYGPPVPTNKLDTSAKQRTMKRTTAAQSRHASGLHGPVSRAASAGSPKMPAPISPLIASAVRSHLPTARTSLLSDKCHLRLWLTRIRLWPIKDQPLNCLLSYAKFFATLCAFASSWWKQDFQTSKEPGFLPSSVGSRRPSGRHWGHGQSLRKYSNV